MRRGYELRARRRRADSAGLKCSGRSAARAVALLLAAALLNLPAAAAAGGSAKAAPATGEVTFAGDLTVNGSPAVSGQTFFPGSTLINARGSRSMLGLCNLSRLELSGVTTLRLDFSESGFGGSVDEGVARFFVPEGVRASVRTPDAALSADDGAAAVFSIDVTPEGTSVTVQSGRVEMSAGGGSRTASAGETLSASRGRAPLPAQGQNLSGRQRAGLFVGITAAVLAVVFAITRQGDDEEPPVPCEPRPVIFSGPIDPPPC